MGIAEKKKRQHKQHTNVINGFECGYPKSRPNGVRYLTKLFPHLIQNAKKDDRLDK